MTEYLTHPLIQKNKIERRKFQENIIASCANNNSLVVIPTGLGKTVIAVGIVAFKFARSPDKKILIMAPTKPLIEQHEKSFNGLLCKEDIGNFVTLTGKTAPKERKELYKDAKLIFATPQVIQNDVATGEIDLKEFSLIIFDEAHRASGDYAYTYIAKVYKQATDDFQILALTASPGGTKEKIGEVAGNLYIDRIEIRTEEDWDVKGYVQKLNMKWIMVDFPDEYIVIQKNLKAIKKRYIRKLNNIGVELSDNTHKGKFLEMQRKVSAKIAEEKDPKYFEAASYIAACIKVDYAIELLESQGLKQLHQYFNKIETPPLSKAAKGIIASEEYKTAKMYTENRIISDIEHPKLPKLLEILNNHVLGGKKAIVFAQYVHTVKDIVRKIENESALKPVVFIGQRKGNTQKKQKQILERFREGEFNVLVSTSVGEEGLDIPDVDLVVFYEPIPSEIRVIQRRGRTARKSSGDVYILITKGTIDEAYYWSAKNKERKMKSALEDLRSDFNRNAVSVELKKPVITLDRFVDPKSVKKNEVKIYVDHRENELIKHLSHTSNIKIERTTLPVGDVIISKRSAIERKEVHDFLQSMIEGKLFRQLGELASNFWSPILIIEGKNLYGARRIHPNAIKGALASIVIDFKIPIWFTSDAKETAETIALLAKREQIQERQSVCLRGSKRDCSTDQILEYIVGGFPYIDKVLAQRILVRFGDIKTFINASYEDLLEVEGIGPEKAKKIVEIIKAKYTLDKDEIC